jgi:hypothetical protein
MSDRVAGPSVAGPSVARPRRRRARSRRVRLGVTVVVAVALVLGLLGAIFHDRIGHQLSLSFVRQADPYSEIYFTDPKALFPLVPRGSTQSAEFAVANRTGATRSYPWVVQQSTGGGPASEIAHGVLTIPSNRSATATFQYKVTSARNKVVLITATIVQQGQHIDFHTRTT